MLTMLKVHLNIVTSDIGCHGNDWRTVKLPNEMTSRHAIEIRHYNVHQDHIVLDAFLNLVHSFKAIKLAKLSK
jgi:hypothetical protein